jgi:hypothetical protein
MSGLFLEKIKGFDHLIYIKSTGTPSELATKMRISVRCVNKYISLMKKNGAPIIYSRKRRTYLYHNGGRFYCEFLNSSNDEKDN